MHAYSNHEGRVTCFLTFGAQVAVEGAVLGKASPTLGALVGLLPGVVADVAHQGSLLPEAAQAKMAHEGLVLRMGAQVDLHGVLSRDTQDGVSRTIFCGQVYCSVF